MSSIYNRAIKTSLTGHGVVLIVAVVLSLCAGWIKRKPVEIPIEFTVVIEQSQEAPAQKPDKNPPKPEPPKPEPPKPEPPKPEPPKPPPEPPPADAVVPVVKPDVKPVVKPVVKPEPDKTPSKSPSSPFIKGERVVRPTPGPRLQPVKLARQPMLSAEEIARLLALGARPGEANVIPQDEVQRCFLLVKRSLYEAWIRPSRGDAGPRPAQIELTFGFGGTISHVRLVSSSGSVILDRSAEAAGRAAGPISGLTARFLRDYPRVTVYFELE
jgi:outer membrane biosynthesis protein TonB